MIRGLTFAALMMLMAGMAMGETLRLAVTTTFQNSGLAHVLLPAASADLGFDIDMLVVGTGQAIGLGRAGDVDAILVHSTKAEEEMVAAGFATHRREIMYNEFVLVGPKSDPAGIMATASAMAAMLAISGSGTAFISRGDDSGTHKREEALWLAAGIGEAARDISWYKAVGAGMGTALNIASGLNAYVLADRASWLTFKNKGELAILFAGDPALLNQYAYLPVNPERHPHVKNAQASALEDWLTSNRARSLINGYRLSGEVLFTFNAKPM